MPRLLKAKRDQVTSPAARQRRWLARRAGRRCSGAPPTCPRARRRGGSPCAGGRDLWLRGGHESARGGCVALEAILSEGSVARGPSSDLDRRWRPSWASGMGITAAIARAGPAGSAPASPARLRGGKVEQNAAADALMRDAGDRRPRGNIAARFPGCWGSENRGGTECKLEEAIARRTPLARGVDRAFPEIAEKLLPAAGAALPSRNTRAKADGRPTALRRECSADLAPREEVIARLQQPIARWTVTPPSRRMPDGCRAERLPPSPAAWQPGNQLSSGPTSIRHLSPRRSRRKAACAARG